MLEEKIETEKTLWDNALKSDGSIRNHPISIVTTVTKKRAGGTKHVGIGHDGTSPGKRGAIGRTIDKLDEPSNYIEASGAIENILRKANVIQVTDEETIRKALKGKEIEIYDDGSYDRVLGGKKYRKTMWGKPTVW